MSEEKTAKEIYGTDMDSNRVVILGIPVDNLTMDAAIERIFQFIADYRSAPYPRLVATVNVDFVVNTLSWRLTHIRHPELIDILRRADMVTADGMPIVWAARMLGHHLRQRVTGADLVPRLAAEAAQRGHSIYFLGGRADIGQRAADLLKQRHPGLEIAGIDAPFVYVQGQELSEADTADASIVNKINQSGADILLIGFGNPKQELWFERNRHRLQVPVSIGVGGTFDFIVGTVKRAPRWIQRSGLEWAFRITQDPARLWKRYLVGFFKYGLMMLPAVLYYRGQRFIFKFSRRRQPETSSVSAPMPDIHQLPEVIDGSNSGRLKSQLLDQLDRGQGMILDFSMLTFIDSSGLGMLLTLWRRAKAEHKQLLLAGLTPQARRFLSLSRMTDLFRDHVFKDVATAADHLSCQTPPPGFQYACEPHANWACIHLTGELDAGEMRRISAQSLAADIGQQPCILNLQGLRFVDSSGMTLFLKIQRHAARHNQPCVMCGLQPTVEQAFRITRLLRLFTIVDTMDAAEKYIETAAKESSHV